MLPASTILLGFVLPALIAAVGLAWGWRWIGPTVMCGAFALAFWKVRQAPGWPPGAADVVDWIFYFAVAIGLLGTIDVLLCPPLWLRALVLLVLWRIMVRTLLQRLAADSLDIPAEQGIDLTTLAALIWWLGLENLAQKNPSFLAPLLLAILSGASAVLLFCWGTMEEAKLAVSIGAIALAATAACAIRRPAAPLRGAASALGLVLLLLLVHAYFYAPDEIPPAQQFWAAVFVLSPLLAFAGDLPGVQRWPPFWRLAARLLPVLLAAGAAAAFSLRLVLQAQNAEVS
ncbi:MAG: hypothetical protein ABR964_15960 [Tepidisphaeraceae bacterium]|jgi:hypothetical protein